jgi:HEAT repeat protein
MATLLALTIFLQDDPAKLVERLRSDSVEEREGAAGKLKEAGKSGLADLDRAAKDADKEVAARAARLARLIRNRDLVPETLRGKAPKIEERLAGEDLHAWTQAVLDVSGYGDGDLQKISIRGKLLGGMIGPAIRGASDRERDTLFLVVARHEIPMSDEVLLSLLTDPETCRWGATGMLEKNRRSALPKVVALFPESKEPVRTSMLDVLVAFRAKEAAPYVVPRLKDASPTLRGDSARALGEMGDPSVTEALAGLLADPTPLVADTALVALARLGAKEHLPVAVRLLRDPEPNRQWYGIQAIRWYKTREKSGDILPFLDHKDVNLQWATIEALGEMGATEALPELRKKLDSPFPRTRDLAREALRKLGEPKQP